jgi:hypothetical protein
VTTADPWYLQAFAFLEVHKDGATTAILLLSATIALIAMVVGPAISLLIAKKQIASGFETQRQQTDTAIRVARLNFNALVVSTNRQRWIDNLRDTVAELVALQMSVGADLRIGCMDQTVLDRIRRVLELSMKVELFINPNEPAHDGFQTLIHRLQNAAVSRYTMKPGVAAPREADPDSFESLGGELINCAKLILKAEWNRVKAGEPEQAK